MYATPVVYTFRNLTTNRTAWQYQAEVPMTTVLRLPEVADIRTMVGLGLGYAMATFFSVLQTVTPADPNSHTTLYDMQDELLLVSTALPENAQFDAVAGALYTSGGAPIAGLNSAYYESGVAEMPIGSTSVVFDGNEDNRLVSSLSFTLQYTGDEYGIVQSTPLKYYFAEVDQLRSVMIGLGVACCVIVVALSIVVAVAILHAIRHLLANMALAAQMKNDRTTFITTFLYEADRLAKGFGNMNDKLLEARAYLPQHLLVTSDDSAVEDDDEGTAAVDGLSFAVSATNRTATSHQSRSAGGAAGGLAANGTNNFDNSTALTGTATTTTANDHSTNCSNQKRVLPPAAAATAGKQPAPMAGGIAHHHHGVSLKRVTVLSVNGRNFHSDINASAPATVVGPVNGVTDVISAIAHAYRGVIDSFHGDHFVLLQRGKGERRGTCQGIPLRIGDC